MSITTIEGILEKWPLYTGSRYLNVVTDIGDNTVGTINNGHHQTLSK